MFITKSNGLETVKKSKKVIVVLGPSRCGKGTFAKVAESFGYTDLHPIQDLKDLLEEILQLPAGALHTEKGKNTPIKDYTKYYFRYDKLYPLVEQFICQHFNVGYRNDLVRWAAHEYTKFLTTEDFTFALDIEKKSYFYFKDRKIDFSLPFLQKKFCESFKEKIYYVLTGVRRLEEANLILYTYQPSNILVVNITRSSVDPLNTDENLLDILKFFRDYLVQIEDISNEGTLEDFELESHLLIYDECLDS